MTRTEITIEPHPEKGTVRVCQPALAGDVSFFVDGAEVLKQEWRTHGSTQVVVRSLHGPVGRATLTERWHVGAEYVQVSVCLESEGDAAWSAPLGIDVAPEHKDGLSWWAPWAAPEPEEHPNLDTSKIAAADVPMRLPATPWQDPFVPRAWPSEEERFWYGAPPWNLKRPRIGFAPVQEGAFVVIPQATLLREGGGLSILASPEDPILDLDVGISPTGSLQVRHWRQRFGNQRKRHFTWLLVPHKPTARAALASVKRIFPAYFAPPLPQAREVSGGGAYSTAWVDFDPDHMRAMGFGINWKASFDFPWMGMFLPPVESDESWKSLGGEDLTLAKMREYARRMEEMGFHCLNYFNVCEFGNYMDQPEEPSPPAGSEWQSPRRFLDDHFPRAVLKPHPREVENWNNVDREHYRSWEICWAMDPSDQSYKEFLLSQARRHLEVIPETAGRCVDRLDWLRLYNFERDDGVSWVEGQPAGFLGLGWRSLAPELAAILHREGKVLFVNNHVKRIDFLKDVDGIFDEFGYAGPSLNGTALLSLDRPAIGWMRSKAMFLTKPDQFMQQYLYMGVHPMIPFPGNDHSLKPDPEVEEYYRAYGSLFNAMRGRVWDLNDNTVVADSGVSMNVFRTGMKQIVVFAFGGSRESVSVRIPGKAGRTMRILRPGCDEITRQVSNDEDRIPLKQGCAMLVIPLA